MACRLLLVIDLNENFSSEKILSANDNVSYYFKKKNLISGMEYNDRASTRNIASPFNYDILLKTAYILNI